MKGERCFDGGKQGRSDEREERFIEGRITNSNVDLDSTHSLRRDLTGGTYHFSEIKSFF
jgi:hypothetical protein